MKKMISHLLFLTVLPFYGWSQTDTLKTVSHDTLGFKITKEKANEIALKTTYKKCSVVETRSVFEDHHFVWKVTLREIYGDRHHGYYYDTYHYIDIDPFTGEVLKNSGIKKQTGKMPEYKGK